MRLCRPARSRSESQHPPTVMRSSSRGEGADTRDDEGGQFLGENFFSVTDKAPARSQPARGPCRVARPVPAGAFVALTRLDTLVRAPIATVMPPLVPPREASSR
jgi:hypothetical protein